MKKKEWDSNTTAINTFTGKCSDFFETDGKSQYEGVLTNAEPDSKNKMKDLSSSFTRSIPLPFFFQAFHLKKFLSRFSSNRGISISPTFNTL